MQELEADIVKSLDCHDDVILPLESPGNEDDWQRASNSKWAKLPLAQWCDTFKQTNVNVHKRGCNGYSIMIEQWLQKPWSQKKRFSGQP